MLRNIAPTSYHFFGCDVGALFNNVENPHNWELSHHTKSNAPPATTYPLTLQHYMKTNQCEKIKKEMGLDSVELLYSIEEEFGIEISNLEAENISTVNELVDAFYNKITTNPNLKCLTQIAFHRLRIAFIELGNDRIEITPSTKLRYLIDRDYIQQQWKIIQNCIELELPKLVRLDLDGEKDKVIKLFGVKIYERSEAITNHDIKKLIDWIISINHSRLINVDQISNRYEVERIVAGIISDNMGIPINDIELEYTIANDLGID